MMAGSCIQWFLLAACLAVWPAGNGACATAVPLAAQIAITTVPAYGTTEDVHGMVSGADPSSHHVAVFIWTGGWWNKPTWAQPVVPIAADGKWQCDITTGGGDPWATRIMAFLLPSAVMPPLLEGRSAIPEDVYAAALAQAEAVRGPADRIIDFSGYRWRVKSSTEPVGPGPNLFSDETTAVLVDASGLHLHIRQEGTSWTCAEVVLERTLGYGTYVFHVASRVDNIDAEMVAGFFTWDSNSPATAYREMDFEFARWGNAADATNAQYVVQPYATPGNLIRYTLSQTDAAPDISLVMTWTPVSAGFMTVRGRVAPGAVPPADVLAFWTYTGPDLKTPGEENVRINLWLNGGRAPLSGAGAELVVAGFLFQELQPASPAAPWQLFE